MNTSVFFIRGYFPIGGFIYLIRYKGKNLILKCQKKTGVVLFISLYSSVMS